MAEYITKEAAINAVENAPIELFQSEWNEIGEMINAVPAADVAPVAHGRWIHHDNDVVTCSECGNAESSDSYYCGYCGAKTDGGAE